MPHEPKVGELPALTEAQKSRCLDIRDAWDRGRIKNVFDCIATAMREGIAAEREARKDE